MRALIENPLANVCIGDKKVAHALIVSKGCMHSGCMRCTVVQAFTEDHVRACINTGSEWCRYP
jgi:hypothetical protein